MTTNRTTTETNGGHFPWLAFVKFLFIVFLTAMLFFLAQAMVRHHFFSGGTLNYRSTTTSAE